MSRYLIVLLAAVIAGAAAATTLDVATNVDWTWVSAAVAAEVALLVLAVISRPDRRVPFLCDPVVLFVGFQAQFFVVGPLTLRYTSFYAQTPFPPERIAMTVLAFVALLATFLLGYHVRLGEMLARALPSFSSSRGKLPGRWVESGLLAACLGACAFYVQYQGGLLALVSRGYGEGRSGAMFTAAFLLLVLATLLYGWRIMNTEHRRRGEVVGFVALLVVEAFYWGILLGQRKWLFHLFFGLITILLLRRGTRAVPRFVIPTIMVLLLVYLSVWGSVRGRPVAAFVQEYSDPRYAQVDALHSGYIEGVAGPFGAACLVFEVFPEFEPYRYGSTLLVALLSPIPRAIWPDKPIGLGKELTRYMGGHYGIFYDPTKGFSITPTLVGDFYANLGLFGILLGGLVFGVVARTVVAYAAEGMRGGVQLQPARVLIPAVFLSGLVELRADSAMLTLFYMYTMIPLLGILTFFSFEGSSRRAPTTTP